MHYHNALARAEEFKAMFPPETYERWEFAGSIRRLKPNVKDVEHVIIPKMGNSGMFSDTEINKLWDELEMHVLHGRLKKAVYSDGRFRWGDKYRGVWDGEIKHEMFLAVPDNWGCIFTIRTGSATFSRRLVSKLLSDGVYRQQDGFLVLQSTGERIPCPNEESFFNAACMKYRDPEDRE